MENKVTIIEKGNEEVKLNSDLHNLYNYNEF